MAQIYYSDTEGGAGEAARTSARRQSIFTEWPVSYRCIIVTDCRRGWWNQPSASYSIMMMQGCIRHDRSKKSRILLFFLKYNIKDNLALATLWSIFYFGGVQPSAGGIRRMGSVCSTPSTTPRCNCYTTTSGGGKHTWDGSELRAATGQVFSPAGRCACAHAEQNAMRSQGSVISRGSSHTHTF